MRKPPTKPVSATPTPALDPTPEPAGEWCVPVSVSVLSLVPNEVLRPWMAVESFARMKAECWPGNAALAVPMGVGSARVVRSLIERLEDHGIVARRKLPGNRRALVLIRRTSAELNATEWAGMADRAARLVAARKGSAAAKVATRRKYRPPTRVVG